MLSICILNMPALVSFCVVVCTFRQDILRHVGHYLLSDYWKSIKDHIKLTEFTLAVSIRQSHHFQVPLH